MTPKAQCPTGHHSRANTSLYWPLVILSDIHFGKKSAAADMLYEFLQHIRCDTLILNGDIIDGWHLIGRDHRPFPEMQKRVIDLLNARIADGLKVVYIPGNHDEALRKRSLFGKNYFGIHFSDSLIYTDRRHRRFFILHGDQFDPQILKEKGKILYHIGDYAYDRLIELNAVTSKAAHKLLKQRFSIAAYAKKKTKNLLGVIGKFEDAVTHSAGKEGVDGIICGHIHHAEFDTKGKILYGNSGDWVESCTALTCDAQGDWQVVHWLDEREACGLRSPPVIADPNPHEDQRGLTERQLRLFQRIWPARDRTALLAGLRAERAQLAARQERLHMRKQALKL